MDGEDQPCSLVEKYAKMSKALYKQMYVGVWEVLEDFSFLKLSHCTFRTFVIFSL